MGLVLVRAVVAWYTNKNNDSWVALVWVKNWRSADQKGKWLENRASRKNDKNKTKDEKRPA